MSGSLAALLQLASPALPVGAYSYSQGLESAIDEGIVRDEATALRWIGDALRLVFGRYEAPVWWRLHRACAAGDIAAIADWNERFIVSRETRELRAESVQMGYSLLKLMGSLGHAPEFAFEETSYPAAHAWACCCWSLGADDGLVAYLYGWAENQVMAAIKSVPLGQVSGQRMLVALRDAIGDTAERARGIHDDALSSQAPMLAILCSRHEVQYSRLFRS